MLEYRYEKIRFNFLITIIACGILSLSACQSKNNRSSISNTESTSQVGPSTTTTSQGTATSSTTTNTSSSSQQQFQGLVFESKTFTYDGDYHSLSVENAPQGSNISYTNNNKKDIGTYTVTAVVSKTGYKTKTLTATLKIQGQIFSGITFKDQQITYDGYYHSIYVTGAPSFANVSYTNNNKMEVGTYTVTATITATGYEKLVLSAKMIIIKKLPEIDLPNRTLIYDGTDQLVSFEYPENLPSYTEASFKVDGNSVASKDDLRVKTVGTHTVSVTLTNEKYSYEATTTTATIKVINQTIGGVISGKDPFKITKSLKYQQLRSEILKGNFTVECKINYEETPTGSTTTTTIPQSTQISYVADNEAFEFYNNHVRTDDFPETIYYHHKIVGNYVLRNELDNGVINKDCCYKYASSDYSENVIGRIGIISMSILKEAKDGGFENGQEGGYATKYATFTIDETNNAFILEVRQHYYHAEFNRDEVSIYKIFNIGNTKINMISEYGVESTAIETYRFYRFYHNGFDYYIYNGVATASVHFDAVTVAYLAPGEYVMPATFDGINVTKFTSSTYDQYADNDLSGYTIKVFFNNSGVYQGEYASIGSITNFKHLANNYLDDGGKILYFGEW